MAPPQPSLDWAEQGNTGPIDTAALRQAHDDFLAVAEGSSFGSPPPGEWDAGHLLAHVAATNFSIASVALSVAAGEHPHYDNRTTLDPWHLGILTGRAGNLAAMIKLVRASGELLSSVADQLPELDLDYPLPTLIVSNDQAPLDDTIPLRSLIDGIRTAHLPLHAQQLRALISH